MKLLLKTDGGARGNPGPAGYGYVISDITSGAEKILRKCGNYCGLITNNQAEYLGLINGIKWIKQNFSPLPELVIVMDSLLIVNQVKGVFRVKHPELQKMHQEAQKLLSNFPNWQISHTPRANNRLADELVNQAIDLRTEIVA